VLKKSVLPHCANLISHELDLGEGRRAGTIDEGRETPPRGSGEGHYEKKTDVRWSTRRQSGADKLITAGLAAWAAGEWEPLFESKRMRGERFQTRRKRSHRISRSQHSNLLRA